MNPPTHAFLRRLLASGGLALVGCLPAAAAEKTYRYFRFTPTAIQSGNTEFQISEFDLKLGGTVLNFNDKDGTGIDVVTVSASTPPGPSVAGEPPANVLDGLTGSKWFQGALDPLILDFTDPVTVDEYNWASANDSVGFSRSPISWELHGSDDMATWVLLDARSNYPITNTNLTYQDSFVIPEEILPQVNSFGLDDGGFGGVSGVVLNGESVSLAWETEFADEVLLSPGPGSVALTGSTEVTPPSNATTEYTLTANQTGSGETNALSIPIRTVAGGTASYRYVRFTATKLRSGFATGIIQLTEFEFVDGDTVVPVAAVTNPGGNNPYDTITGVDERVPNLIDGDLTNKWLDFNNQPVVFDFGEPTVENPTPSFDSYAFVTGNDAPGRDPINWKLEGSDDGTTWTLIENIDYDYPTPSPRQVPTGDIPLPGASLSPSITTFTGDALTLFEGQPLNLSWEVEAAATVMIDQTIGTVDPTGTTVVNPPLGETTYTLSASSAGDLVTTTATFTVTVIELPDTTTIEYDDFSEAGAELQLLGSATISGDRLQLTPELNSQSGTAWFLFRQDLAAGFESTFGLNMNKATEGTPADGIAFTIQNSAEGSSAQNVPSTENGLPANALNISFRTYVETAEATSIIVFDGTTELASASVYNVPGTELTGLPGNPYTLAIPAGSPSYQVRVVYVPGDLDVYLDGIAVIQNLDVDLASIGAVNESGEALVGFGGRTGGLNQASEITDWHLRLGDFTETLPFGLLKALPKFDPVTGDLFAYDLVWNAEDGVEYDVLATSNFSTWDPLPPATILGVDGQLGFRVFVDLTNFPFEFYRVVDLTNP